MTFDIGKLHTKTQKRILVNPETNCWEWQGAMSRQGYVHNSKHRSVYETYHGPIPEGFHIDHLCRNRRCLNPDHLEAVTQRENNRRAAVAQTHCKHGHEFTEQNTGRNPGGYRYCRICKAESNKRWLASNPSYAYCPKCQGEHKGECK